MVSTVLTQEEKIEFNRKLVSYLKANLDKAYYALYRRDSSGRDSIPVSRMAFNFSSLSGENERSKVHFLLQRVVGHHLRRSRGPFVIRSTGLEMKPMDEKGVEQTKKTLIVLGSVAWLILLSGLIIFRYI